jgi:hypothetical protein
LACCSETRKADLLAAVALVHQHAVDAHRDGGPTPVDVPRFHLELPAIREHAAQPVVARSPGLHDIGEIARELTSLVQQSRLDGLEADRHLDHVVVRAEPEPETVCPDRHGINPRSTASDQ